MISLNLPINRVSFGQVSFQILKTLFDREKAGTLKTSVGIFPIGELDFSAVNKTVGEDFAKWIQDRTRFAIENHKRTTSVFRLWHLDGSLASVSERQTLLSFHELDSATKAERNAVDILNNKVLFSSKFSCEVFGLPVETNFVPLGFDDYHFKRLDKKYHQDDRIVFNVCGKFERRKNHDKVIRSWIKKYGKNPLYALQCCIYNSFLSPEDNNRIRAHLLGGKTDLFNVNFFPVMKGNELYNDFLNSADVILGMSGGEGWGLPEFQSVALGKHAVMLDAHSYKDWANEANSVLVKPSGKISSIDGVFFREGTLFNQGNIFDFNEDEFIEGCEKAIARVRQNRLNSEGLKLQTEFSREKFVDAILTKTYGSTFNN